MQNTASGVSANRTETAVVKISGRVPHRAIYSPTSDNSKGTSGLHHSHTSNSPVTLKADTSPLRILLRYGIDASPAEARALTARLAAHGQSLDKLSASDIVTAIILQRNNVDLDPSLLSGVASDGRTAINSVFDLTGAIETFLTEHELSAGVRAALLTFKDGVNALFNVSMTSAAASDGTADAFLNILMLNLSAEVRSLLDTFPVEARLEALNVLAVMDDLAAGNTHTTEGAYSGLIRTIGDIRAALPALLAGSGHENLNPLLSNLTIELEAVLLQTGVQLPAGHMGTLVQRYFNKLLDMLDIRNGDNDLSIPILTGSELTGLSLKNQAVSNGMHFEWRLLAWYRAGGGPRELRSLMHRDLKGLVSMLIANLRERDPVSAEESETISDLVRTAREVHRTFSREQLACLSRIPGETGRAHFTIPLSSDTPREQARIAIRSRDPEKNDGSDIRSPYTIDLNMQIEHLGHVTARLIVHHSSMNITFLLENESLVDEARARQDELVQTLGSRGFRVESVTCAVLPRETALHGAPGLSPDTLDMTI